MAIQRRITQFFLHPAVPAMNYVLLLTLLFLPGYTAAVQDDAVEPAEAPQQKKGYLVQIDLPIDGRSAAKARQAISNILDQHQDLVRAEDRPVVVLELDNKRGATGQGSSLGACIDFARFLTGPDLIRIKTVAYVPGQTTSLDEAEPDAGRLTGHAVLVALAANQLALHPDVKFGTAGIDETTVDSFVLEAYKNVVAKRLTVPVPLAMAMLEKSRELFRVIGKNGPVYVNAEELKKLEAEGPTSDTATIATPQQSVELSGSQMAEFGLIRRTTPTRVELARQLGISVDALQSSLNQGQQWEAVLVPMPDFIDETAVQWISRALEPKIASRKNNLLIFEFDSLSGDVDACLLLARKIAAYDPNEVRTVAFINQEAAGPAALIALSCFHVVMQNDAKLGGEFEPAISETTLDDIKQAAVGIAETLGKDTALIQAMLQPNLEVSRYRNKKTGDERLFTEALRNELIDGDDWLPQAPMDFSEPMNAATAANLQIARQQVASIEELKSFYQVEDDPELLKPSSIDRWLHRTALFLASPFVAPWLLFMGMFLIFNEVSQPGLGVPGFLGTLCLILYFWSQHLGGNANWLEILLFLAGIVFLMIEVFVVPGIGIFGIGGMIMVVVSIVLASQTFVFPTTTEQFNQLPKSVFAVAGAFGGIVFAMIALRTILPNTPFFKKIMLEPPVRSDDDFDDGSDHESMVNWGHLVGRRGTAITNLAPSGKARIDGQLMDVISEGRLIEKDQAIEVIEVSGNRVVVAPA